MSLAVRVVPIANAHNRVAVHKAVRAACKARSVASLAPSVVPMANAHNRVAVPKAARRGCKTGRSAIGRSSLAHHRPTTMTIKGLHQSKTRGSWRFPTWFDMMYSCLARI